MTLRLAALALGATLLAPPPSLAQVPEPDDYRGAPYHAEVPATLAGAHVIDDSAARALWLSGRVAFVDVLPQAPRPDDLPSGTLWIDRPNHTIPGAIWLPDTGYASLSPQEAAYLATGLAAATGGALDAPVVIFCLADCWMSWNAARRAVIAGYSRVFWYPRGTDGWSENGWPLAPVAAHPR